MAALSTNTLNKTTGASPAFVAAAASDTADVGNGKNTFVEYRNTDTNAKTVTLTLPGTDDYGVAIPDVVYTLAANTGVAMIPLLVAARGDDGRATLSVTGTGGVTGVTVRVVRMVA
jgi:flagellar hook assembly protein FlgD